ncbi:MAG TPA: hypothetical protein DCS87_15520 [Rheinheimera sp.]|nr:hypothetical protein [Rheinheimera sp.]
MMATRWLLTAFTLAIFGATAQETDPRDLVSQQPLEQAYRQAAWFFYQEKPYDALLQLDLAPTADPRSDLLKGGLLLQIGLPKQAADLMQQILQRQQDALPEDVRQYALLQYSRYLLNRGDKTAAKQYAQNIVANPAVKGVQQQLLQMLDWPDIQIPAEPDFDQLDGHPEMPYVIMNQIQALAAKGDIDRALAWQEQLSSQLDNAVDPWFWQRWFGFTPVWQRQDDNETTAVLQYLQLLRAQLFVRKQDYPSAQAVLSEFPLQSPLNQLALETYAEVLAKSGQTGPLLGVYQQQLQQHPFALSSWRAATNIGLTLEKTGQKAQALAALQWAERYFDSQISQNKALQPLTIEALEQQKFTPWQSFQFKQDKTLFTLKTDLLAMKQLTLLAPEQLKRIQHLQKVVAIKLQQQTDLLHGKLPELSAQLATLEQQYQQLHTELVAVPKQTYPNRWLPEQLYKQQQTLDKAAVRLSQLSAAQQQGAVVKVDVAKQQHRLNTLQGLAKWQYASSQSDTLWQLKKQQQQLQQLLPQLRNRIGILQAAQDATPRLKSQQQRLAELNAQQQALVNGINQAQQQLLAELNQQLQQRADKQLAQLLQLSRRNKQALARLMEEQLQEQSR